MMIGTTLSKFQLILCVTVLHTGSSFVYAKEPSLRAFSPKSSIPTEKRTPTSHMFALPLHNKIGTTFAGKISPVLSKLYITRDKANDIISAMKTVAQPTDLMVILTVGWILLPLVQIPYEKLYLNSKDPSDPTGTGSDTVAKNSLKQIKAFRDTKLHFYTHLLAEAGRIAGIVYIIDCVTIALSVLGFDIKEKNKICAKIIYSAWIFLRVNKFRKYLVSKAFRYAGPDEKRKRRNRGREKTINQAFDIMLWGCFLAALLDLFQVKAGVFLNSFFAVGGVGTLLLSFASKDLAMQFVSGFALQASDKLYEGEEVEFSNGISGLVLRVGIFETLVKHHGEMVTAVPNKELVNNRLTNLSRLKFSKFSQTLRFDFDDADKITQILEEIKKEIRETCPHCVSDGSRPFRVYWSGYGESCLEVMMDVRMSVPPIGDRFFQARQDLLLAIQRALTRTGTKLVILDSTGRKIE